MMQEALVIVLVIESIFNVFTFLANLFFSFSFYMFQLFFSFPFFMSSARFCFHCKNNPVGDFKIVLAELNQKHDYDIFLFDDR
jgi:hypothetical protein